MGSYTILRNSQPTLLSES